MCVKWLSVCLRGGGDDCVWLSREYVCDTTEEGIPVCDLKRNVYGRIKDMLGTLGVCLRSRQCVRGPPSPAH